MTCGLLYILEGKQSAVPLEGVNVKSSIVDFVEETIITQYFMNREVCLIEANYVFPLDESAAVCGFVATWEDGRQLHGVVEEKKAAQRKYQQAVDEGKSAALLEEVKADVFTLKVGNILPGERVRIDITYICEIKSEDDFLRFFLPMSVAPRWTPVGGEVVPCSEKSSWAHYGLSFEATVLMSLPIVSVTSPSHAITQERNELGGVVVRFADESVVMDGDFVLLIGTEGVHQPRACVEVDEKGTMVGLCSFFPHIQFVPLPNEIIFVVDRSGSMSGSSIRSAAEALNFFIRALPATCRFEIVGFGSQYETLFGGPVQYDEQSLKRATQHVSSLKADLGGTDLKKPLDHVFSQAPRNGFNRQVFVLTDGQVSNTKEVCDLVAKQAQKGRTRVFALGVGNDVSHDLVEGLARSGKGTAKFVVSGEPVRTKVLKQLKDSIQPQLTDIKVEWRTHQAAQGGSLLGYTSPSVVAAATRTVPDPLPPIFDGEQFIVYAFFPPAVTPTAVHVSCNSPDGPIDVELPMAQQPYLGSVCHRMAARAQIKQLEDRIDTHASARDELLSLALSHSLVSSLTSFVAVDDTKRDFVPYGRQPKPPAPSLAAPPVLSNVSRSSSRARCSAPRAANDRIADLNRHVNEISSVMACNIEQVLERDETLDILMNQSEELSSQAVQFKKCAKKMKRKSSLGGMMSAAASSVASLFTSSAKPSAEKARSNAPVHSRTVAAAAPPAANISDNSDDDDMDEDESALRCEMRLEDEMDDCLNDGDFCDMLPPTAAAAAPPPALLAASAAVPPPPPAAPAAAAPEPRPPPVLPVAGGRLPPTEKDMVTLVMAQKFDGSFDCSHDVLSVLHMSDADLEAQCASHGISKEAWLTILVLAFFNVHFAAMKEDWEMAATKAKTWAKSATGKGVDSLVTTASAVIRSQ